MPTRKPSRRRTRRRRGGAASANTLSDDELLKQTYPNLDLTQLNVDDPPFIQ